MAQRVTLACLLPPSYVPAKRGYGVPPFIKANDQLASPPVSPLQKYMFWSIELLLMVARLGELQVVPVIPVLTLEPLLYLTLTPVRHVPLLKLPAKNLAKSL